MIKIDDFNNLKESNLHYGGHRAYKVGVIINGENWFLKYPKKTKYTVINEYLGSHIYEIIGIDVQETKLGIYKNKLVVACKDFLSSYEMIEDYNSIDNEYSEYHSHLKKESLEKLFFNFENNSIFKSLNGLEERFWDMFIIDTFISNNKRSEEDWGIILNRENCDKRLCPVFDNDLSFNEEETFVFTLNGKKFNPIKYIESKENNDLNDTLIRIFPRIDMNKIKELFDCIPEEYEGITVFSKITKEAYYKILEYRYNLFKKIYEELK